MKEVGPDRACAEWLLRCGAHVRRLNSERFQTDYNSLPAGNVASYKIEEINADNAAVMSVGFPYLEGLNHLKKIRFYNCVYLDDEALIELSRVKHTLEELEVGSCGVITDKGIASIAELELLKVLKLYDLPAVRDKRGCFEILKKALPQCDIQFPDAVPSTTKST
ncbi:ATP synthase subunit s, mitochondrial-like [Tubulanus polymorphus]|uniref:ATP synthase subunit s, mitochondrial-like n=1 Tax=Tubulanus polymorphus TaxID=672921 RepID=UPI003DA4A7CE